MKLVGDPLWMWSGATRFYSEPRSILETARSHTQTQNGLHRNIQPENPERLLSPNRTELKVKQYSSRTCTAITWKPWESAIPIKSNPIQHLELCVAGGQTTGWSPHTLNRKGTWQLLMTASETACLRARQKKVAEVIAVWARAVGLDCSPWMGRIQKQHFCKVQMLLVRLK